jgi:hypothetical protein
VSYDLFFIEPEITLQQLEAYFSGRNHYKVENNQAWYENEDTGVYFCFDYSAESEDDPEAPTGKVSFNLNFYRPHFFAIEAEPEVHNFVKHFGFKIHDPQTKGMGEGQYNTDGFFSGWNHGNEFGYKAIMKSEEPPEVINTLPGNNLEAIWRWNYVKQETQNNFVEDIFVPGIIFIQKGGKLLSIVVWPDAIPTLIPQVDAIVIPRQELAPRRIFKKRDDLCIVNFGQALPLLEPFRTNEYVIPSFKLSYSNAPDNIKSFVKNLKPLSGDMNGVPVDQILNEEIINKHRKG